MPLFLLVCLFGRAITHQSIVHDIDANTRQLFVNLQCVLCVVTFFNPGGPWGVGRGGSGGGSGGLHGMGRGGCRDGLPLMAEAPEVAAP